METCLALRFLLMAATLLGFALPAAATELAATPAAVQTAIRAQLGDGKLEAIDATNQDGELTYDVSFTAKSGEERGFTVADDGTLLSVVMELSATPAAVQSRIRERAMGWELEEINKNVADTEVSYDVEVSKDGKEKSFSIASNGDVLSEGVALAETPAPVQAAIQNKIGGGSVVSISENFDEEGKSFDVRATAKDGGTQGFSVGMDGKLLSIEVTLDKTPPPVRKTIHEKIGKGTVLHIDRMLVEKRDGVLPFEVEGRKNGKPFNFSVGPKGRFLGMDD